MLFAKFIHKTNNANQSWSWFITKQNFNLSIIILFCSSHSWQSRSSMARQRTKMRPLLQRWTKQMKYRSMSTKFRTIRLFSTTVSIRCIQNILFFDTYNCFIFEKQLSMSVYWSICSMLNRTMVRIWIFESITIFVKCGGLRHTTASTFTLMSKFRKLECNLITVGQSARLMSVFDMNRSEKINQINWSRANRVESSTRTVANLVARHIHYQCQRGSFFFWNRKSGSIGFDHVQQHSLHSRLSSQNECKNFLSTQLSLLSVGCSIL